MKSLIFHKNWTLVNQQYSKWCLYRGSGWLLLASAEALILTFLQHRMQGFTGNDFGQFSLQFRVTGIQFQ